MGTLSHAQSEFFRTCVRALTGRPWRAVITVGNGFDTATLGTVPPNIEVYPWVPQVAVLEHADVFVTSGGLGSLMGAVHTGTPMLMAPTCRSTGSPAYARRSWGSVCCSNRRRPPRSTSSPRCST